MKTLFILLVLVLFSCEFSKETKSNAEKEARRSIENKLETVGKKIQGDFNGDNQSEYVSAVKLMEQQGNPVEGGIAADYQLQFSNTTLPAVNIGCCDVRIINEGDLDNDGADELSICQAPANGCVYSMTTYSFKVATGCKSCNHF